MRFLLLMIALAACTSELPAPAMKSQPTSALVAVPFPPPPAHVEAVPDVPKGQSNNAVWIDGEWIWRNKRWLWQRGRWVTVPTNGTYSPWTVVRDRDGNLYWARGVWRAPNGEELVEPKPLAVGADVVGGVIDSEGNTIEQGRVLQPPGAQKK